MDADSMPVVVEVLDNEPLPAGSARGDRRLVIRWSSGEQGTGVEFFSDEVLFGEGDLISLTAEQIKALHFSRDRDYLQRED